MQTLDGLASALRPKGSQGPLTQQTLPPNPVLTAGPHHRLPPRTQNSTGPQAAAAAEAQTAAYRGPKPRNPRNGPQPLGHLPWLRQSEPGSSLDPGEGPEKPTDPLTGRLTDVELPGSDSRESQRPGLSACANPAQGGDFPSPAPVS